MARGAADFQYHHVQKRTWSDRRFRRLSAPPPCARYLWFFLLSGEYTTKVPGVIAGAGRAGMAEFLEWPVEEFDRCFAEVATPQGPDEEPMAIADWPNRIVYLPSAFKQPDNHPSSTAEVVSWRKVLNNLPECELRDRIEHDLRMMLMDHNPSYLTSFVSARRTDLFSKPDNQKALPAASPTVLAAESPARSPLPDPLPLPLPDPLPKNSSPSADAAGGDEPASSSSNGVQEGFKLEPTPAETPSIDFDAVYKLFPRKEGKSKGKALFDKHVTNYAVYERFVQSVRNYAAHVARRDPEHIKQFDTFMRCWEDYAPGNFEPPRSGQRDLGRGQVPVARGIDYSTKGDS